MSWPAGTGPGLCKQIVVSPILADLCHILKLPNVEKLSFITINFLNPDAHNFCKGATIKKANNCLQKFWTEVQALGMS